MSLLSDLGARIGAQLKNKLDKTAKAADSDKLDGLDSSQFLRSDVQTNLSSNLSVSGEFFATNMFGGFPLAPNMIHNSYMNRTDANGIPLGWSTVSGVTIKAVSPFTKAFEGRYVPTSYHDANPSLFTNDPELATETVTYWYGNYNKGPRIQRGGMGDGWHSLSDGKILKISGTGFTASQHNYVSMPMERNNLGAKWLFYCWVKIVKGTTFGAGVDSGYMGVARGDTVSKATTDAGSQGWYRYFTLATSSQITSLDGLAFSIGITPDANGDFEYYIALPYLANVNYKGTNLDVWTGSTLDKLMREGVYITPLSGNMGIGQEASSTSKLAVAGNIETTGTITTAGSPVMTGTKTISTSAPSGGSHGDVWYQV